MSSDEFPIAGAAGNSPDASSHRVEGSVSTIEGSRTRTSTDSDWVVDALRPGDLVVVAQATGEPTTLLEHLVARADRLRDIEVFVGLSHTQVLKDAGAQALSLSSFGAMGHLASLSAAGRLAVLPQAFADVPRALARRSRGRLVVALQVGPEGEHGRHSLGVSVDYTYDLVDQARLVVAEINDQVPWTTAPTVSSDALDVRIASSRPVAAPRAPRVGATHRAIARNVAGLVDDGSTIQLGVGAVPSAVGHALGLHRGLEVRSTLVGDWLLTLAEAGALSDRADSVVISEAAGSRGLHRYVVDHQVRVSSVAEVCDVAALAGIRRFVAMNAALQVDLTGQVNAEEIDRGYIGGIGGQPDFMRAAQRSREGKSVVMLPATTADGATSRIVPNLQTGVVTTPRSSVDFVVTEHGVAELRGRSIEERVEAMIQVAAPQHRADLRRAHP